MTKSELRTTYLQKRKALSESEYTQFNHQICELFFSKIDLSFIKIVHSFLPITTNREPDTWLIIDRIRREFPNIRLSIPRINQKSNLIESFFFEGLHQLDENNWGIQQPRQGTPADPSKIDLVFVPLLAHDSGGNRVGYGKGYYDKFLATCRVDCQKMGISFFEPVESISDISVNDIRLTSCLTPKKLYSF